MPKTKDEGYIIRCTKKSDGEVTYLRLSAGRHHLCGMFGPCFKTPEEAQEELKFFDGSIGTERDMDVVKVVLNVEEV